MDAFLPYGRQTIEDDDVAAVVAVLRSERLAHGPTVGDFERAFAEEVGAEHAVACSSGTTALQLALMGSDTPIGPGDLVIVPAITFLSTATVPRWLGAEVRFADVDPETGLMTVETLDVAMRVDSRFPAAVIPVHLGGRMCDMDWLEDIASGSVIVEDAAHALGSVADGLAAGSNAHSNFAAFSLHPVKTIAAGEGGMVTTNDAGWADRMRRLANQGVTREGMTDRALSFDATGLANPWSYEQVELGFNGRMDEMSAALGLSQLGKLQRFKARRAALAALYDQALAEFAPVVRPVLAVSDESPCLHLYQVRIDWAAAGVSRASAMRRMAEAGIGTQVHYAPVYRQPYFRRLYGEMRLPGAEAFYASVLALPLFPAMADGDVERVVEALTRALQPAAS